MLQWVEAHIQGNVPPRRGLSAAVQRGNQLMLFGGLSDEEELSFELPEKGRQVQLLHFNDLYTLEIQS